MSKKQNKSKDKFRVYLGFAISAMVVLTAIAYFMSSGGMGYNFAEVFIPITAIVLAGAAAFMIKDRMKNVKAGLPFEDEYSKKVFHKAGYYAYLFTLYFALGVSMFEDVVASAVGLTELTVSQTVGLIILVPAIAFFAFIFYFRNRGDVE